jgi:large subunit ribosomal protein L32
MANPKNRTSRTRRDMRRTHWKLLSPSLGRCPQCHEPKLPHRICGNCGYYDGKVVVEKAE